ncbi:hypothetical protein PRNP1_012081 [Phytophthora ramorum]
MERHNQTCRLLLTPRRRSPTFRSVMPQATSPTASVQVAVSILTEKASVLEKEEGFYEKGALKHKTFTAVIYAGLCCGAVFSLMAAVKFVADGLIVLVAVS